MQWSVIRNLLPVLAAVAIAGCGGSSSKKNAVAAVNLGPASVSIVSGQVSSLSVSALDSTGNPATTTFTFNSSNPGLVTVSPGGQVCGGVWDSTFVVCNGNDASGNALTGTATVTATAAGISSAPVTVSVHPSVTSIAITAAPINAPNPCISNGGTQQFTAKAFHNGTDITSSIGPFTWSTSDATVATIDANGLATARNPGEAQMVASVGTVTSQSVSFDTCMPKIITLHVAGDPANAFTFSATMNVNDTKALQADMFDVNGTVIPGFPIRFVSNNPAVATISGTTLTATGPGGTGIMAVCAPTACGNGINRPVYSNLFSVSVNGTSPSTTVYVATSTIPAPGTSPAVVPIDTSKSPPAAGTPIIMPGAPTSMAFSGDGTKLFVDTSSGLVAVDALGNTATLLDADPIGIILAVSPDGTKVIVSNVKFQADVASQRLFIFDTSSNTLQTFILPGAVAAAFTGDGFKAYIAANNGNVYVWSPFLTLRTVALGGSPRSVANIAAGPLTFFANSGSLDALNVCDNSPAPSPLATGTQLLAAPKNQNVIDAFDGTSIHVITATLPNDTIGLCPPGVTYSDQAFNFGLGSFTANQLLVGSNGPLVVVLPAGIPQIGVVNPSSGPGLIPIAAGGTQAVAGSLTLDGNILWAGVAGTNTVHRINLTGDGDDFQLQLNLNNTNAVPDIIAVRPR